MEACHVTYPVESELLERSDANGQAVSICQRGDVAFVRFHGLADFALDMAAGTATIEVTASSPPGMDEVLAAGPVLALALALRGQPCLHASAVSIRGQAVAFTAPSGGGKSTLAALACRAGAELVVDDTLAVAVDGSDVRCLPGSRGLRLRPVTAELLAGAAWPRRRIADARWPCLSAAMS
jgi:ABC-type multidrug transport system fused ATPase/permease subunit